MQRLRLSDCRASRLPVVIGACQGDLPTIARYVNGAQRRLLYAKEAGDESWWGTWAEIAFNVSRAQPYITLPRDVARLESVNVCNEPIGVQNQFFEYLQFGNGRLPKQFRSCNQAFLQAYSRNNAVTFVEMSSPPQYITVYITEAVDANRRVLIQGLDVNDNPIYTQDVYNRVSGDYITLEYPFVQTPQTYNRLTGIQKDVTAGEVKFYQTDPTTGDQVLLLTMGPTETTASYRRYYFDSLPCGCCPPAVSPPPTCASTTVTAIAKLELIPVTVDQDYLLLQNLEAIIEEAQSIRYSEMDTPSAKQMAQERHIQAIRLLNGELTHYLGAMQAAVEFAPFGSARLERVRIGMI